MSSGGSFAAKGRGGTELGGVDPVLEGGGVDHQAVSMWDMGQSQGRWREQGGRFGGKSVQRTGAAAIVTLGPLTVTTSPSGRTASARVARHGSPPFQSTGASLWTASA